MGLVSGHNALMRGASGYHKRANAVVGWWRAGLGSAAGGGVFLGYITFCRERGASPVTTRFDFFPGYAGFCLSGGARANAGHVSGYSGFCLPFSSYVGSCREAVRGRTSLPLQRLLIIDMKSRPLTGTRGSGCERQLSQLPGVLNLPRQSRPRRHHPMEDREASFRASHG